MDLEIRDRSQLEEIEARAPGLKALIIEAAEHVKGKFRGLASAVVEVDPSEEPGEPGQAHLVVETSIDAVRARALLDELDEAWWLGNLHRAGGRLSLGLRLV